MKHPVSWTEQNEPVGLSLDQLLYRMRRHDSAEGLLFDSVTMDEILQEEGVEQFAFDALVSPFSKLKRKMEILSRTMDRAIDGYDVAALQVSSPFKHAGVAQVAAVFELADGQTVSVYFHNPDNSPGKLSPSDEMISWKWLLNKKDITIVVAPERGSDLQIREVARRIMKLAKKNGPAFTKANAKRAERLEVVDGLRTEISDLEYELADLQGQIEVAEVESESRAMAPYKAVKAAGIEALNKFRKFLGRGQYRAMLDIINGDEGAEMASKAQAMAAIIEGMAATYEQDGKGDNATVYLHYFQSSADWYITEKDVDGGTKQAFGYADLGQGGELGYISIDELTKGDAELDLYFDPKPLKAVKPSSEDAGVEAPVTPLDEPSSDNEEVAEQAPLDELKPEPTTPEGYAAIMDDKDAMTAVQDQLDSFFQARMVEVRNALRELNWEGDRFKTLSKNGVDAVFDLIQVGAGANIAGITVNGFRDDLSKTAEELAAEVDALAALPVSELPTEDEPLESWQTEKGAVEAMSDEQFTAEIKTLNDENLRSEALVLLAKRQGTNEQITEAQSLLDEHNREGEASPDLIQRRDALRAAIEAADGELEPEGATNIVKTAKGTQIETGFTLVEAESLIASHDSAGNSNPDYPPELQPRDRGRDASIAWVRKIANDLDPDSLGKTRRADTGAPIVGPDGVVESGNGRTMAIQEAYRSGKADEYREWLTDEAEFFGLNADKVRAMKAPVLVRVRTSDIDRREFAIEANQDDKLSMTATEKARADSDRLDDSLISRLSEDGNLLASSNRDFLAGFMASLGDTEAAQYTTSDGAPTASLIARVQAAIFSRAYNDDRLLEMAADVTKPEVANVIHALNTAAPEFIRAQAADQDNAGALTTQLVDSVEVSLNEQAVQAITDATNLVRIARSEGSSVDEMVSQRGLFGDISPATAAMAMFINQNNRSSKRLGVAFRAMAEFLRTEAERGQTVDIFGDSQQSSLEQIIDAANRELNKQYGEGEYAIESLDMFGETDEQALEQAREDTDTDPTDEQKESGDYEKGDFKAFGLDITIENSKGSERSGESDGKPWSITMPHDYGYIKGTKGMDGDEVDVFIGPDLDSETAYVIDQMDLDGAIDEHKVMLGFDAQSDAEAAYLGSYKPEWDGMGRVREMTLNELSAWLPLASSEGESNEPEPVENDAVPEAAVKGDKEYIAENYNEILSDLKKEVKKEVAAAKRRTGRKSPDVVKARQAVASKHGLAAKGWDEADMILGKALMPLLELNMGEGSRSESEKIEAIGPELKKALEGYGVAAVENNAPLEMEPGNEVDEQPQPNSAAEAEEATPAAEESTADTEFLQSVIDQTLDDPMSADIADQLGAIFERNSGDSDMEAMIERAAMVYQKAVLQATANL